jgi:hypothetical protein
MAIEIPSAIQGNRSNTGRLSLKQGDRQDEFLENH